MHLEGDAKILGTTRWVQHVSHSMFVKDTFGDLGEQPTFGILVSDPRLVGVPRVTALSE